jgi:PAS domain S-box-containing protein
MIKVLYIDYKNSYSKSFLDNLIDNSYGVKYTSNLKEAYELCSYFEPDLVISEMNFDDGSGISFIKKIKEKNKKIKSILLLDEADQKIFLEAIDVKIDKILFKNSSFKEIINEINTLDIEVDTNQFKKDMSLYDLGEDYFYEQSSYRIIHKNEVIQLTSQESLLLEKLLKARGNIVEFEALQNYIGKNEPTTIETLRTVVKKIRRKTYDNIIENQSGIGYKLFYKSDININGKLNINKNIKLDTKVLILKGDKRKNDSLKYDLEKLGLVCENAYTIEDAKSLLYSDKYNYLVSDLNLPDGEIVDLIRDIEDIKSVKTIVLSPMSDIHYKEYLYFRGIVDYLIDTNDINYLSFNIYKTILKIETNTTYNEILIIEKSKKICEQLKDILLPRNYKISALSNLDNAIEIVKSVNISLIIIDLEFDDCYDFLTDVKTNINESLPFIVLSDTHRAYETVRDSYKYGASECLRKPVFAEEFILKVDQLAEGAKLISELKEQKEFMQKYKDIVDNTTIVSKTDHNGIITYVNEMFCRVSGYSKDELVGKAHSLIRHPDTSSDIFKEMWKTIKEDRNIWQGVLTNKAKNGKKYTVDSSIMPILDQNNKVIEFIALRKEIK